MKVYDCFLFHNEIDLLALRLEELDSIVTKFMIVEGNVTHQGADKELTMTKMLAENHPVVAPYKDKIVCHVADLKPYKIWDREFMHRNTISAVLNMCQDDDLILISDVDEIPDVDAIAYQIRMNLPFATYRMAFHYYSFKYKKKDTCHGTAGILAKELAKTTPQHLRDIRFFPPFIQNAGWHLSYFGSPDQVIEKIKSISHEENVTEDNTDFSIIENRIKNGKDVLGRTTQNEELIETTNPSLPITIQDNPEKYKEWL
jgi:beta-1,4-mannosyl-glycoprotein beta-1,4-N-acetylglucosaminyltransferase